MAANTLHRLRDAVQRSAGTTPVEGDWPHVWRLTRLLADPRPAAVQSKQIQLIIRRPPPLPRLLPPLLRRPNPQPLLLARPLGVEDEEAVDDLVLERLQATALVVRRRRDVRRHLDVRPAVGREHRAVHVLVETAELGDSGVVAGGVFEVVVGLGEALLGVDHVGRSGFVEALAGRLELGDLGSGVGVGEGEGLETVGGAVVEIVLHR